jgi:hypothetical protein
MRNLGSLLLVLALLTAASGVGFVVNSRLPEKHRSKDAIELIGLAMSLLITFTAIVLGLLTTSVKSGFDAAYAARGAYAAELAQLDRCLADFGSQTAPIRADLRAYVAAVIASTWPDEPAPAGVSHPDVSNMARTGENSTLADIFNRIGRGVMSLQGADDPQRNQAVACRVQYAGAIHSRWLVIEGVRKSISTPFYWVLIFWLVILFSSFGLRAPPNTMSIIVIGLSILSVAVAMFVILDMDIPYGGLFGIPSTSMRAALADMMR